MRIKREKYMAFRATTLEKRVIESKAKRAGLTTAEFCRSCALGQKLDYKLTDDEIVILKELTAVKLNFVRISNLIKERKELSAEVRAVIELVTITLQKLR